MHTHDSTLGPRESRPIHWARRYDLMTSAFGRHVQALHRRLLDAAAIGRGERVLDVGCGPGRLTMQAAAMVGPRGESHGIDLAPEMIALARQKAARAAVAVVFEVAGIDALPFADRRFDLALSNLVLHHLPEETKKQGFAEVYRVLAPGGRFLVCDFRASPGHGLGHLWSLLGLRHGSEHADHLRELMAGAGFVDVEILPAAKKGFAIVRGRKPGTQH